MQSPTIMHPYSHVTDILTSTTHIFKVNTDILYAHSWSGQGHSEVTVLKRCVLSVDLKVGREAE